MTKEHDLAKLENIVENLLQRFNSLKKERSELVAQLEAKEEKIGELEARVMELNEDQSGVHGRVSSLLCTIEEWEKSLDSDENISDSDGEEISTEKFDDDQERTKSQLFSIGE